MSSPQPRPTHAFRGRWRNWTCRTSRPGWPVLPLPRALWPPAEPPCAASSAALPATAQAALFRSNRGTRVSYDAVHYQWAKLCKVGGLVDIDGTPLYTPHQLRHTRGSELLAQGQRVEIVQRVLGHRDIRSTLGYAELQEAQVRAALECPTPR